MMKNIAFVLSVFVIESMNAQQVVVGRSSINCVGSSTLSNGILISQTGGQSSSVSVSKSGNLLIRQGFQQSTIMQYEVENADFSVQLFPNPNDGNFNVSIKGFGDSELVSYKIININGRELKEIHSSTPASFAVSILGIQPGVYYLDLNSTSGKVALIKFIIQ